VEEDKAELVTGQATIEAFQQLRAERHISC
jgi:hypothetical protein